MTPSSDPVRFNLQLPAWVKQQIERAAERRGRSVAAIVREALEEYLRREEDALFVAELRTSYGAVRDEDLELVANLEGIEAPVQGGEDGTSKPGGRVSGKRGRANRVRRRSGGSAAGSRRSSRKHPQ